MKISKRLEELGLDKVDKINYFIETLGLYAYDINTKKRETNFIEKISVPFRGTAELSKIIIDNNNYFLCTFEYDVFDNFICTKKIDVERYITILNFLLGLNNYNLNRITKNDLLKRIEESFFMLDKNIEFYISDINYEEEKIDNTKLFLDLKPKLLMKPNGNYVDENIEITVLLKEDINVKETEILVALAKKYNLIIVDELD